MPTDGLVKLDDFVDWIKIFLCFNDEFEILINKCFSWDIFWYCDYIFVVGVINGNGVIPICNTV